jgi:hypothetical protein
MDRWCEATQHDPAFRQQIDPLTGNFTQGDMAGYSPAALACVCVKHPASILMGNAKPSSTAKKAAGCIGLHSDEISQGRSLSRMKIFFTLMPPFTSKETKRKTSGLS